MLDTKPHRRRQRRKQRHFSDLSPLPIFLKLRVCRRESRPWQRCQICGANLQGRKSRKYQRTSLPTATRKCGRAFRDNSETDLKLGRIRPCAARTQCGRARDFLRERILLEPCAKPRTSSTIRARPLSLPWERRDASTLSADLYIATTAYGRSYLRKSPSTSALAFSDPFGSTLSQVESGSNWVMAVAKSVVLAPRSF